METENIVDAETAIDFDVESLTRSPSSNPIALRARTPLAGASMMLELAITQNLDLDKLDRIIAMNQTIMADAARAQFYSALAGMQSELTPVPCEHWADMKTWGFWYADLAQLQRHVQPLFKDYQLSYTWSQEHNDKSDYFIVTCLAGHAGGHVVERECISLPERDNGQTRQKQNFAAITAGQRKSFSLAFGIVTEVESGKRDGPLPRRGSSSSNDQYNPDPSSGQPTEAPRKVDQSNDKRPATGKQLAMIQNRVSRAGIGELELFRKFNFDGWENMQRLHVDPIMEYVREVQP